MRNDSPQIVGFLSTTIQHKMTKRIRISFVSTTFQSARVANVLVKLVIVHSLCVDTLRYARVQTSQKATTLTTHAETISRFSTKTPRQSKTGETRVPTEAAQKKSHKYQSNPQNIQTSDSVFMTLS